MTVLPADPDVDLAAETFRQTVTALWRLRLILVLGPTLMGASIARAGRPVAGLLWALASAAMTAAGLGIGRLGGRRAHDVRWRRAFVVTAAVSGAAWGAAPFLLDPTTPAAAIGQVVPPIAVLAVTSVFFALHLPSYVATALGLAGPFTISLVAAGEGIALEALPAFGAVAMVFTSQAVWANRQNRRAVLDRRAAEELADGLRRERAAALVANERLQAVNEHVRRLAERDHLTGAYGRRVLVDRLAAVPASARERHVLVLVDLDHFKAANDRFGHAMGDDILCHLVAAAHAELPAAACLARWGGEEFALLLDRPIAEALALVDRVRAGMRARLPAGVTSTFSAGVARWDRTITSAEVLRRADTALYEAKANGRNRTEVFEPTAARTP